MSEMLAGPSTVCDLYSGLTKPEREFLTEEFVLSRCIPASLDFLRSVPYPLAEDAAGAVAGIVSRYVYPLPDLKTRYLSYWVYEQLRGEPGITALPLYGEQFGEDVSEYFPDAEDLLDYRNGVDFTNGLAGIRDEDFVARCDLVESMVEVAAEEHSCIGYTVPLQLPFGTASLTRIPLIDGSWIDRRVVELAELAAALDRAGYRQLPALDPHPLAWHRIYPHGTDWKNPCEAEPGVVADMRQQSAARLNQYRGRVQEFDGHPHLHIEEYAAWEEREVPGDLMTRRIKGVVVEAWNSWIDRESDDGWIDLYGEIVGKFDHPVPWQEGHNYRLSSTEVALRAARLRSATLAELVVLAGNQISRPDPGDKPEWDAGNRELRFRGKLIRTLRDYPGSKIHLILDSFQEEGWPSRILDPLPPQRNRSSEQRRYEAVDSLNANLQAMVFSVDGDGFRWKIRPEV